MSSRQPPLGLPPQDRQRAIAELDRLIGEEEARCDRQRAAVAALEVSSPVLTRAGALLRFREERLDQLRRSREVLLHGERPDADEDDSHEGQEP